MALPQVKVGCCGMRMTKVEYARLFSLVEVQQTFYQPPRVTTLQRWRTEVPPDFEFTLKAWQVITHPATSPTYKRLKTDFAEGERRECGNFQPTSVVHEAWLTTRACAEALSAKCVLFQCPASFTPTEQNIANLRQFFGGAERKGLRFLWEPRGDWTDELIESLCRELGLTHVVDPFLRRTVTRDSIYYRLHGGKDFKHCFNTQELRQLEAVLPRDKPAYVLFNNVNMVDDAMRFQEMIHPGEMLKVA